VMRFSMAKASMPAKVLRTPSPFLAFFTSSGLASSSLCAPERRGKRMRRFLYSCRRATLIFNPSSLRFWRRGSTAMPIVAASLRGIPAVYMLSVCCHADIQNTNLELSKGESTSFTNATVVLDGWASHHGAELVDWTRSDESCLLNAVCATTRLAAGLLIVSIQCSFFVTMRWSLLQKVAK
jgi:hypothetical protein